jgi:murein DD-endopeptidase MepM/ murein hydrolase activator NlpD
MVVTLRVVPDQPSPGVVDAKLYETLQDPRSALTGNTVLIDHGHDEYSALSHLQKGSVRAELGQRVRGGDQIGSLGSSGSSELPHLHYQLMAGQDLFRSDGLPARPVHQRLDRSLHDAGDAGREAGNPAHGQVARLRPNDRNRFSRCIAANKLLQ